MKKHKYLIIIDDRCVGRFDGQQVCVCETRKFPAKTYTRSEANKVIKKSDKFRENNNLSFAFYSLLRVED